MGPLNAIKIKIFCLAFRPFVKDFFYQSAFISQVRASTVDKFIFMWLFTYCFYHNLFDYDNLKNTLSFLPSKYYISIKIKFWTNLFFKASSDAIYQDFLLQNVTCYNVVFQTKSFSNIPYMLYFHHNVKSGINRYDTFRHRSICITNWYRITIHWMLAILLPHLQWYIFCNSVILHIFI